MLTLSAGSSCDVCFERFGRDHRVPCSIVCGHVFCLDCVSHVNRLCPLCRTPFEPSSCIKLHLDIDTPATPEQGSSYPADDEKEAQRIHRAILRIADCGIEEQALKQLIQEGRDFLHRQPRQMYKELRSSHRMMAYMCELKSSLRGQRQMNEEVNEQFQRLSTERAELMQKLADSEELRNYERETALAVETSLREHCTLATRNYQVLIQVYNKLAQSTHELLKTVPASTSTSMSAPTSRITSTSISDLLPPLDMKVLDGVAAQDPESTFLISPLPQFTNNLPSVLGGFTPLPELAEDAEGEEKSDEEELSTPDSSQNHKSIQEVKTVPYAHSTGSISPPRSDNGKGLEPSGLSRTAPYLEHNRRGRSSSNPSLPTSRSHSPFDRSGTTSPRTTLPQHVGTSSPPRYQSTQLRNTEPDALRTRLHDLLRDSPASTSMPNIPSTHFPSTLTNRERDQSAPPTTVSPPTIRTGSSNPIKVSTPSQQPSPNDGISHLLASGQPQTSPSKPAPSPSPNHLFGQKVSSASAQAKQLEEERRRRHLEEKQHRDDRYKEERTREERPREERQREDRNREDWPAQEHDRFSVEPDRDYRSKTSLSASVAPNSAGRREQPSNPANTAHIYGNPVNSNNGAALKRGGSVSGVYHSRPTPVLSPPPQHGPEIRYPTSNHKSRSMSVPTNPAGIYAP